MRKGGEQVECFFSLAITDEKVSVTSLDFSYELSSFPSSRPLPVSFLGGSKTSRKDDLRPLPCQGSFGELCFFVKVLTSQGLESGKFEGLVAHLGTCTCTCRVVRFKRGR